MKRRSIAFDDLTFLVLLLVLAIVWTYLAGTTFRVANLFWLTRVVVTVGTLMAWLLFAVQVGDEIRSRFRR